MSRDLDRYVQHGHRMVDGWLGELAIELTVFLAGVQQQALGLRGPVAEIGVHHGRYLILLALLQDDGAAVGAWDLFSKQGQNTDYSGAGDLATLVENVTRHVGPPGARFVIEEVDSRDLTAEHVRRCLGSPPVLFSIDGGHTKAVVLNDLAIAMDSVADGGLLVLDDYMHPVWPEVTEALYEFLPTADGLQPICSGGGKLFLIKDSHGESHRALIEAVQARYGFDDAPYQIQESLRPNRFARVMTLGGRPLLMLFSGQDLGLGDADGGAGVGRRGLWRTLTQAWRDKAV